MVLATELDRTTITTSHAIQNLTPLVLNICIEKEFFFLVVHGLFGIWLFKIFLVKFGCKSIVILLVKSENFILEEMTHLCSWKYHTWHSSFNELRGSYLTMLLGVSNSSFKNKSLLK